MDELKSPPVSNLGTEVLPAKKINIKKVLDVSSWVALFILTPAFFVAFLSQNSLPGDFLYPVKRGIEGTLLTIASANPTTKAFFHTDLTERRFTEAEKLLLSQANTAPLEDFVAQIQSTEVAIDNVSDPVKQEELTEKVIAQIDSYQTKLTNTAAKIQSNPAPFAQAPSPSPAQSQVVTATPTPAGQSPMAGAPTQSQTVLAPSQVSQPVSPTQVVPSAAQTPQTTGTPEVEEQKRHVEQAVEITKLRLEKVKEKLEEKSKQREEKKEKLLKNNNSAKENKASH